MVRLRYVVNTLIYICIYYSCAYTLFSVKIENDLFINFSRSNRVDNKSGIDGIYLRIYIYLEFVSGSNFELKVKLNTSEILNRIFISKRSNYIIKEFNSIKKIPLYCYGYTQNRYRQYVFRSSFVD